PVRRHRRRALQADRRAGRRADLDVRHRERARPDRPRSRRGKGRRRARGPRDADVRGAMIGTANGYHVSITGLGAHVPERVVTNDELAGLVDTTDEWIRSRTGIRERRVAAPEEALSDVCLPAAREALQAAAAEAEAIDL